MGFVDGHNSYRTYLQIRDVDPEGLDVIVGPQVAPSYFEPGGSDPLNQVPKGDYDASIIEQRCLKVCQREKFFFQISSPWHKWCREMCINGVTDNPINQSRNNEYESPCKLQVCCRPVGFNSRAHCVIRFVGNGNFWSEGCRGGPTGEGNQDFSKNRQSSHCSGCCGQWGNIVTACGQGDSASADPAETGLAKDLKDANDNPDHCRTLSVSFSRCHAIRKCVHSQMAAIEQACYRYGPAGNNSNSTWRSALSHCLQGGEQLLDPPGFQPGNQILKDNDGMAKCK